MTKKEAIEYLQKNKPTSGFEGLAEAVDIAIESLQDNIQHPEPQPPENEIVKEYSDGKEKTLNNFEDWWKWVQDKHEDTLTEEVYDVARIAWHAGQSAVQEDIYVEPDDTETQPVLYYVNDGK